MPGRSRANVVETSSPGPGIRVDESAARACTAAFPRRMISTRISSGPEGTGEQNKVLAETGLNAGSPTSAAMALIATVISTPPAGVTQFQASGRSAVYQPGASLILWTAVSIRRSAAIFHLGLRACRDRGFGAQG